MVPTDSRGSGSTSDRALVLCAGGPGSGAVPVMRGPYAAVVFDLDGTLLDTEALTVRAGAAAMARRGFPIGETQLKSLVGLDQATCRRMIEDWLGDHTLAVEAEAAILAAVWAAERDGIPLKPGVMALLGVVTAMELPRAVATSSERERAAFKLGLVGLAHHFHAVVALEDVARPKPAPDPYLKAAEALAVDPARILVFEDSEAGTASALAAGATVVQVPDIALPGGRAHFTAGSLIDGARAAGLIR